MKMVSTPLYPVVLLIIIPFLNGYFIGGIPHFQTYTGVKNFDPKPIGIVFFFWLEDGAFWSETLVCQTRLSIVVSPISLPGMEET